MSMLFLKPTAAGITPVVGTPVTTDGTTPNLIVEVDWDTDPTEPIRSWTDITADVRALSYTLAGRQHELQRTEAGTLNCTLSNRAGDYDPTNTAGAYTPNVKLTRWIRVRSVYDLIYPEWQGLIETITGEWTSAGKDAYVTITASDVFKALNLFDLNGRSYPEQKTGARILSILADAGIPAGTPSVGISTLPAITFTSQTSALSHLQNIEETENGIVFADATGSISFHDRHYRALYHGTSLGTIGDAVSGSSGAYGGGAYGSGSYGGTSAAPEIPYAPTARYEQDDTNLWNRVVVTSAQDPTLPDVPPTPQIAVNQASIDAHYERTLSRTLLVEEQAEARSAAEWLSSIYAEPSERLPVCEPLGRAAPSFWPVILGAKISDRFVWKRRPSTEAAPRTITLPVFVERKATTIIPGTNWNVSLQFSPAIDVDLLIWDVSSWDSGAIWSY